MKILVIGSGAREHAIALSLVNEQNADGSPGNEVLCAPGNAGIAEIARCIDVDPLDPDAVAALATAEAVDLVVVGPEAPLVAGVSDAVRAAGIAVFGPSAEAAKIEGSKAFAKRTMGEAGVPTGRAAQAATIEEVESAIDEFGAPYVIKADGLAAGKGVIVTSDREAALAHAREHLRAGEVLVEEFLDGVEVSLFVLSDGKYVAPLAPAQDFKRLKDGDEGPNTGGMGAYSPLPWLEKQFGSEQVFVDEVVQKVAQPVVDRLAEVGSPFVGLLYCGLIVTADGVRVIEFNARFGDPETQTVLPRLRTPLSILLNAAATGDLDEAPHPHFEDEATVTVVIASEGYPHNTVTGREITGVDEAEQVEGVDVIHAATKREGDALIATGGRVLSVVGTGPNLADARAIAYEGVSRIRLEGSQHRDDIALRAVEAEYEGAGA